MHSLSDVVAVIGYALFVLLFVGLIAALLAAGSSL